MTTSGAVRAIRERSMGRMRAERDADRAVAYALAGLWDAVELLSDAIDDDVDPRAKRELERLVRSLPVRLASVEDDALATAAVAGHVAEVLQLDLRPRRSSGTDHGGGRRRCGG